MLAPIKCSDGTWMPLFIPTNNPGPGTWEGEVTAMGLAWRYISKIITRAFGKKPSKTTIDRSASVPEMSRCVGEVISDATNNALCFKLENKQEDNTCVESLLAKEDIVAEFACLLSYLGDGASITKETYVGASEVQFLSTANIDIVHKYLECFLGLEAIAPSGTKYLDLRLLFGKTSLKVRELATTLCEMGFNRNITCHLC